ncbi:MAG: flippase-like domain-containing protein [Lachnospiraceae bacterium]|nr:flippase-like domain-containing protein [Lachnospiraceae bacterium]
MDNKETKKKSKKSSIITAAFFVFSLIVVAVIAIIEFGGDKDRHLDNTDYNVLFILAAISCFLIALVCETLKYALMLKEKGYKHIFSLGYSTAVIGKYYDRLAASGAGGQGFQIYHLKQNGCDDGTAGSLPIVGFLSLQFAFVFLGIITMIFGNRFLSDDLLAIKITAIVGLFFYAFVPVCIIIFGIAPKALESIVRTLMKGLHKIHIIKDVDASVENTIGSLRSYNQALRNFGKNRRMIIIVFVLSLIYQAAFMSLPFFVLHFFGSDIDFLTCFFRVIYIYAAITIVLTPGNSGAAEASFYMVFSSLSGGAVFWGMLVWRLLCYYSWIIAGAISQLRDRIFTAERNAWHKLPCREGSAGLFVDIYYPNVDGVVTTVNSYASNIPGSYVVCPGSDHASVPLCSYDIVWLRTLGKDLFKFGLPLPHISGKAIRYIKSHRVAVFHAHSPFPAGWMALKYGRRLGVPVVATFHSKYYDDFLNVTHSKVLAKLLVRFLVIPFYERADVVWACSKSTARTLIDYGFKGTVGVMENGTDMVYPADHDKIRRATRARLGIPFNRKVILFVGQLVWHKNIKLVLDSFKILRERGYDYQLILTGEGYDGKGVKEYANSLKLGKNIRFMGRVDSREEIKKIYLISDLFFFPSRYDNAPLTLREAAALKVCPLLLENTNAAECIENGINGFTGPEDPEKMADLIADIFDRGLDREVGERASATIPSSWEEICSQASQKYAEIAENYEKKSIKTLQNG